MAKTGSQLDTEIQTVLGLPAAIVKRFKTKLAAYKKAVADMESGYSEAKFWKMVKARDALDAAIYDAGGHVPYVAGRSPHLAPPIVDMQRERDELVKSTWERAKERGHEANQKARAAESKRLREEEREIQRLYDWMRR